ncbi:MAG: phosphatase PAP2 family protein [Beijerinckiaceae bacterium]
MTDLSVPIVNSDGHSRGVWGWLQQLAVDRAAHAIWSVIVVLVLSVAATFPAVGLSLEFRDVALNICLAADAISASFVFSALRPDVRLARLFRALAELILITYFGGALSYAASTTTAPLWDSTFEKWDSLLGFHWPALLAYYDANPTLNQWFTLAYNSMLPQIACVVVALATVRDNRRIDAFILSFGLAAIFVMAIAAVTPAVCASVYYAEAMAGLNNIRPTTVHLPVLVALRSGELTSVVMGQAKGLITFPSFHAVSAMLFMISWWRIPYVRWPAIVVNLAMLAGTPIEGGHYLVDILAGIATALITYAAARRIVDRDVIGSGPAIVSTG